MLRNILTAASITWFYSVLLGLFFAANTSGRLSAQTLRLPGVLPIAIVSSTIVAVLLTPLVMWAFRPSINLKDLISYGGLLFILLMIYIAIFGTSNNAALALYGPVLLGIIGIVVIGFIRR